MYTSSKNTRSHIDHFPKGFQKKPWRLCLIMKKQKQIFNWKELIHYCKKYTCEFLIATETQAPISSSHLHWRHLFVHKSILPTPHKRHKKVTLIAKISVHLPWWKDQGQHAHCLPPLTLLEGCLAHALSLDAQWWLCWLCMTTNLPMKSFTM